MLGNPSPIVIDACVLAGTIRRQLVLSFAEVGLLTPIWSTQIIHETRHAIPKSLKSSGIAEDQRQAHADQVVDLIQQAFPAAVHKTHSNASSTLTLPDPDDVHVLALAIETNADIILTENLKDFPTKVLASYNIKAMNTAGCLSALADRHPELAKTAIQNLIRRIGREVVDEDYLLKRLKEVGMKRLSTVLRQNH